MTATDSTALQVQQPGGPLAGFDGAHVTPTSLALDEDVTEERAAEIVSLLGRIDRSAKWWLGDWMLTTTDRWGEDWALHTGSDSTGYSETALSNWMFVTQSIPAEFRDERLDFTTYIELAKLVRARQPMDTVVEVRDRLIRLREEWPGRSSGVPFPNHKIARQIVEEVLSGAGVEDRLFDFPTTEEELAETRGALMAAQTALEDAQLQLGTHVRCPACRRVSAVADTRVVPRDENGRPL